MCAWPSPSAEVVVNAAVEVDVDKVVVDVDVDVEVDVLELVVVVVGAVPVVTVTVTVVVCWGFFLRGLFFWSLASAAANGSGDELVVMSARPTPASAANARPTIAATTEPRVRGFVDFGTCDSLSFAARG